MGGVVVSSLALFGLGRVWYSPDTHPFGYRYFLFLMFVKQEKRIDTRTLAGLGYGRVRYGTIRYGREG